LTGELRFAARFDAEAFRADIARTTPAGREVAEKARRDYEATGVARSGLRLCDAEGSEGAELPHCLKVYLPPPASHFGMVFEFVIAAGRPRLEYLAFGVRHHPPNAHAPTVYEIAHRRLRDD
jgi:hypothetical protein